MSNIKLKNSLGNEVTYNGVTSIKAPLATGTGYATFLEGGASIGYNVTLNVDNTDWQIISVLQGNSIIDITSPAMSGKVFAGWSTTSGGSVDVTFPYTPTANVTLYAVGVDWSCTVAGLGSSSPSSVTFNNSTTFPTFEEVTIGSNIFIKIPKMYRKVVSDSSSQITGYIIASEKVDSTYYVYPCFLKEDGVTEMDYILMGKYCCSSSSEANSINAASVIMTIGAGRTLCQSKGTGYLQMDWQIFKVWQDLLCAKMQTIDTNSGSGISTDVLGICWEQNGSKVYPWIDGINRVSNTWVACNKPTSYADSATSSTTDYYALSYTAPGSSGCISKLGYDTAHPFVNYPSEITTDSNYSTYYCDYYDYSTSTTNSPVISYVGAAFPYYGAFDCDARNSWSYTYGVRLCYRPL